MKTITIHRLLMVLAAAVAMVFTLTGLTFAASTNGAANFTDVKTSDWFYGAVDYSVNNGIVSGTSATTFSPYAAMTRGQFVTVLGHVDGVDTSKYPVGTKFTDVKSGSYYGTYVYWANGNGIVSGTSANTFSPDANITREQMATIVANYLKYKQVSLPTDPNAVKAYADAAKVSSWAKDAVETLRSLGLLSGDNNKNVNPQNNMTRAEGVAVFMRLCEKLTAAGVKVGGAPIMTEPNGDSWFTVSAPSFTISLDQADVGMYSLLTPAAQAKAGSAGYSLAISSISDRSILNTKNGFFVPLKEGTVTVKWVVNEPGGNILYASTSVTVSASKIVICTGITATLSKNNLEAGQTAQLNIEFTPVNTTDKTVTYISSNNLVAQVSSNGLVTAIGMGQSNIQIMSTNGKMANITVTVTTDPAGPGETPTWTPYDVDSAYITAFNDEAFRILNAERQKLGLDLVSYNSAMQPGATVRANEIQEKFSHIRPNGKGPGTAFEDVYAASRIAECIAYIPYGVDCSDPEACAASVVNAWLNSPGHRAILMKEGSGMSAAFGISHVTETTQAGATYNLLGH